jgi:D-alanyl-D-alanine carboxypeptidase (penicillin-binding protein 5/6)
MYGIVHMPDGQEAAAAAALDQMFEIKLDAQSAFVMDVASGAVLFSKNPEVQLPLASVTKIMLALAVSDVFSAQDIISIPEDALVAYGDSGLSVGERWRTQDLIDFTLVRSSNDGAEALALRAAPKLPDDGSRGSMRTVGYMNALANELGLTKTYFLNASGLDESVSMAGAYGSSEDIAKLLAHIIVNKPGLLAGTARDGMLLTNESGTNYTALNTNEALGAIPGLIAGKTGYTDLAGGNLAVAFDAGLGQPIVAVVLASSRDGRFEDMKKLVEATRSFLQEASN